MGQVPHTSYGIVGDGRLARHFAHYFNLLNIPYRQWSRSLEAEQGISPIVRLEGCETILVMISDSAIESWIESFKASSVKASTPAFKGSAGSKRFVHFSGALVTPLAVGLHPLMSFSKGFYEISQYEKIPFVCEKDGPGFSEIFPKLPNPHYSIDASQKAFYHALCVMSGNFTVLLWEKMFADLEGTLGVPAHAAIPYLEQVVRNLKAGRTDESGAKLLKESSKSSLNLSGGLSGKPVGPGSVLTGPLARGDLKTIQKNLDSLDGDPFQKIYKAFVEAHLS
jgi:predicted short-subunit dehydrogenase-like oxidoreductase (DUF2520 family)